jgi:hypothetical protein
VRLCQPTQTGIELGERVRTTRKTRPEMVEWNDRSYTARIDLLHRFLAQQIEVSQIFAKDGHVVMLTSSSALKRNRFFDQSAN